MGTLNYHLARNSIYLRNVRLPGRHDREEVTHLSGGLYVTAGGTCASLTGKVLDRGPQDIFFEAECTIRSMMHELLNAPGLVHTHVRQGRDKYIVVNWQNIVAGKAHNFEIDYEVENIQS